MQVLVQLVRRPCLITRQCIYSQRRSILRSSVVFNSKNASNNDEQNKKKRAFGMMVGSSIGILSMSYVLYRKLGNVEAKEEESTADKKTLETLHKSQAGFKERKDNILQSKVYPTLDDRPNLPLVMSPIQEVLRFSSIVPSGSPHKSTKDGEIMGHRIPKHTAVFYNEWSMHFNENIWENPQKFHQKDGWMKKASFLQPKEKIIEYENRIRHYSTPDKIFRYFATLQDAYTGEVCMTPEDFVRSLTPDTMQPCDLGLDKFIKTDFKTKKPYESEHFGNDSVFHCFNNGGLINFSDYIFLLTILGTSSRQIGIAFKMFDLNGDGEVSMEEFEKVRSLFLSMSTTGSRHRDRKTTGNTLSSNVNTGFSLYLFGVDGEKKLSSEEFVAFKRKLQKEVMYLEFVSYAPTNGLISELKFAEMLLSYASFPANKHAKIMKRVRKFYGKHSGNTEGVEFEDYLNFFDFLLNIRDIEMALSFHTVAGQTINKETFKQVARTVAGVELRHHLVDVVFTIFDENEDNHLSNKEFVAVMKDKMFRGLNKPKDTGFTRLISAMWTCMKSNIADSWVSSS